MTEKEPLIPKHGGYRKLKSFQLAQLVYDITVRFCDRYIDKRSRTHDQMVQAARSGVQNIAEGSQASATSKKTELKLTNVARASLEELRLDYEDFLRQRELPMWEPDHPALKRWRSVVPLWRMCGPGWRKRRGKGARTGKSTRTSNSTRTNRDGHGLARKEETKVRRLCPLVKVSVSPCQTPRSWPMPRFLF